MKGDLLRLNHVREAILSIEGFTTGFNFESFKLDQKTQSAVLLQLAIIGEAVNHLSKELVTKHSDVPWREIVNFRNVLIHEYFRVDAETIWETCQTDLSMLKRQVELILAKI